MIRYAKAIHKFVVKIKYISIMLTEYQWRIQSSRTKEFARLLKLSQVVTFVVQAYQPNEYRWYFIKIYNCIISS